MDLLNTKELLQFYLDDREYKHGDWPNKDVVEMRHKFRNWIKSFLDTLEQPPKIHGWVARAKNGELALFSCKPERDGNAWDVLYHMKNLNAMLFPDLKWEDEPIEVELIVRPI